MKKRQGMRKLDLSVKPDKIREAEEFLNRNLIGHKLAKERLLEDLSLFYADLRDPNKPIGARILIGSSGVGKTYMAKLFAYVLMDAMDQFSPDAPPPVTLVNCSELQERHEISKLTGTTFGYVGFFDENDPKNKRVKNPAMLLQENIDAPHKGLKAHDPSVQEAIEETEALDAELTALANTYDSVSLVRKRRVRERIALLEKKIGAVRSVIIFDEFEKAHQSLGRTLLQILEEGKITLGNNRITLFNNSYIFLTSNLAQEDIKKVLSGKPRRIGLGAVEEIESFPKRGAMLGKLMREKVKRFIPTELLGRFGGEEEIVDFQPLKPEEIRQVLRLKIAILNERLEITDMGIILKPSAEDFLVDKGYSALYGARMMNTALKKYLLKPLASLKNSYPDVKKIIVRKDKKSDTLIFYAN